MITEIKYKKEYVLEGFNQRFKTRNDAVEFYHERSLRHARLIKRIEQIHRLFDHKGSIYKTN